MTDQPFIDIYFWAGRIHSVLIPLLAILCLVLIGLDVTKASAKKIIFYPCILCASTSLIIFYAYAMEFFTAYYSGAKYEMEAFKLRITGPYWYAYVMSIIGFAAPILLFFNYFRKSLWSVFVIALIGAGAIYWERFIIFVTTSPHFQ